MLSRWQENVFNLLLSFLVGILGFYFPIFQSRLARVPNTESSAFACYQVDLGLIISLTSPGHYDCY